jgi:hypothetical protein
MIIQHPDGSYEICPLAPAMTLGALLRNAGARWLLMLLERARAIRGLAWLRLHGAGAVSPDLCRRCSGGQC